MSFIDTIDKALVKNGKVFRVELALLTNIVGEVSKVAFVLHQKLATACTFCVYSHVEHSTEVRNIVGASRHGCAREAQLVNRILGEQSNGTREPSLWLRVQMHLIDNGERVRCWNGAVFGRQKGEQRVQGGVFLGNQYFVERFLVAH